MADEFCLKMPDFYVTFTDLLHAVNLRHGTNGFTSLPKEGVVRIFSPWKIRLLRPGLNSRTWVPKASTLPLDHRSRFMKCSDLLLCIKNQEEHKLRSRSKRYSIAQRSRRSVHFLLLLSAKSWLLRRVVCYAAFFKRKFYVSKLKVFTTGRYKLQRKWCHE